MASRKKSLKKRRRPASRQPGGYRLKVLLASLFLVVFLVASLVLLSQLRQAQRVSPSVAPPQSRVGMDDVRVELESALLRTGASLETLDVGSEGDLVNFEVRAEYPSSDIVGQLGRRLKRLSPDLRLDARPREGELYIFWGGLPRFLVRFRPPPEEKKTAPDMPRVAIIMDDLGGSLKTARELLKIPLAVTFSVLPNVGNAPEVATLAHREGRQVMVHIPMEPQSYPVTDPGPNALFVDLSADEIRRRFQGYLEKVPFAVGGNNHMGSRFTQDRKGMETVIEQMKEAGLFFVDSRTTGRSVAYSEARKAGVPAATRDRFLDNEQDVEKIAAEIRSLVRLARRKGSAVGICHPYAETLEALRREASFFREQGVEVVPASGLLTP